MARLYARADTDESLLAGINDSGLVVGGIERGFIWDGIGELVRLGSVRPFIPFSEPADINNRGQVVGAASSNFGDVLPFLWEDGTIRELPGLGGWTCARQCNQRIRPSRWQCRNA